MKTYKYHGTCIRHHTSAFPVEIDGDEYRWASFSALLAMKPTREAAFASMVNHPEHDRLFAVVTDGESWGTRCVLSRGYPGEWPKIKIFDSQAAAEADYKATIASYTADTRWTPRQTGTSHND